VSIHSHRLAVKSAGERERAKLVVTHNVYCAVQGASVRFVAIARGDADRATFGAL